MTDALSQTSDRFISYAPASRVQKAWLDVVQSCKGWRIWIMLSWMDIRLRYRRSQLGPFWITLSMAITIYTMGFLYGHLFKMPLEHYFPYLAAGMLTWSLISQLITETSHAFIEAEYYITQMKVSFIAFVLRVVCRNLIVFAHNILVIVPVMIFYHIHLNLNFLLFIPGLLLILLIAVVYGTILALFSTRYRDVTRIIISLVQVIFFVTPIMWSPEILPQKYHFAIAINPFAQFVEMVRAPLMGQAPSAYAVTMTLGLLLFGAALAFGLFAKVRHRIVFWL